MAVINGKIKQYDCPKLNISDDYQKDDNKTDSKERKKKKMADKKPVIKISKEEAEAFDTSVSDKLKTMSIRAAIKDTDREIMEDIEKMAGKKNNSKIVKIRIDNYADLESITGKLAKAGLWVTTEDVEDWPSPTKLHYLCIGVDNEVCTIHKIDELFEDDK